MGSDEHLCQGVILNAAVFQAERELALSEAEGDPARVAVTFRAKLRH